MLYGHVHNTFDEVLVQEYQEQVRKHQRAIHGSEEEIPIPCQMINCFACFLIISSHWMNGFRWIENGEKN